MAGRYSRRRGGRRAPLRKFVWARSQGSGIINSADTEPPGFKTDLLEQFKTAYGADPLGTTVMRVRGQILVGVAAAPGQATHVPVGIRTFTEQLTPDEEGPLEAPHADWMGYIPNLLWAAATPSEPLNWLAIKRTDVDIKANRKMEELGQGLGLFVEHDLVGVTGDIQWDLSIGLKLP